MPKLNFFTPVTYISSSKSFGSSLLEKVDNYFYLGGKKAYVINGLAKNGQEKVILSEFKSSFLARVGKVFSYFTIVVPIFMLIAKAVLRSTHSFKVIDPKQKIEKGMNISDEIANKIQTLMPKILKNEKDQKIEYLKGSKVFKLKEYPNLVFKMGVVSNGSCKIYFKGKSCDATEIMEYRYNNMVKAKEICLLNNLGLLIIPHAKKFNFITEDNRKCVVIAEECMDINQEESAQKEFYTKYSKDLNETARQLAIFVARTGFNDVTPRNVPIINEVEGFQGPRRVALIDLEHMESSINGFIGDGNGSCGLIGCVGEDQIDIVISEARKKGITISDKNKQYRLQEIDSDKKLKHYYENKGILTGKEPIQVDIDSLGLDLEKEGEIIVFHESEDRRFNRERETVTLRKVLEDLLKKINELIQEKSDQESIKGKRYILIDTNHHPFAQYRNLGMPDNKFFISKEGEKQLWLNRIVAALIDKGHIFKLAEVNGHGYFIQA